MNPISIAVKGKGAAGFVRRARRIAREYGYSCEKMATALDRFAAVVSEFDCSATFPITSVVLRRNPDLIRRYQKRGIEFAVHGYRHTDFSRMPLEQQVEDLSLARQIFLEAGIEAKGFRSPYLRYTEKTLAALRGQGFEYDASQALAWNCLSARATPGYKQALQFYNALSADDYPSLPQLDAGVVQIPYSLPDDESLVDRFAFECEQMAPIWLAILDRTVELGELFTVGIHPERISPCEEALRRVLRAATNKKGEVWIARMDQIASWWRQRTAASVKISEQAPRRIRVQIDGPSGTTVLIRGLDVNAPTRPAFGGYRQVQSLDFSLHHPLRPFVGVAPGASSDLIQFLREQGFILDIGAPRESCSLYLDLADFGPGRKRALLDDLEQSNRPLVRLGRWPHGHRSALAITGDIDALTRWDYGLRFFGR